MYYWMKKNLVKSNLLLHFWNYIQISKTSLNVRGLSFYPFHELVTNFCRSMQDFLSSHGHTILAYLPIDFYNVQTAIGKMEIVFDQKKN